MFGEQMTDAAIRAAKRRALDRFEAAELEMVAALAELQEVLDTSSPALDEIRRILGVLSE